MLGMDWMETLNANSGAIVAVTATVSAILTVLLLLEARTTRNLRREATVEARAKAYPPASFLLELEVRNFGPANAREVVITYWMTNVDGAVVGESRRQGETLMGPNEGRGFLPVTPSGDSTLNSMADAQLTLNVEWSWRDDRRRLWFFPLRHSAARSWSTVDLARDFFQAWALTERDAAEDLHLIAEKLKEIEQHQKAGKRVMERGLSAFSRWLTAIERDPDA
jgi:hypothetical protein